MEGRKASQSYAESLHIVRPNHLNGANRLYGGILVQWIDEIAALSAKRHSHCNIVTASFDNLQFLQGAYQNQVVLLKSKVTYVGRTSMEVKVETYVEDLHCELTLINRAFITEVAIDENDRPCPVPPLIVETEEEQRDWRDALKRREIRQKQKEANFQFYR